MQYYSYFYLNIFIVIILHFGKKKKKKQDRRSESLPEKISKYLFYHRRPYQTYFHASLITG